MDPDNGKFISNGIHSIRAIWFHLRWEPQSAAPAGPGESSGRVFLLVQGKGKPADLNQGANTATCMSLESHFVVRTMTASEYP